MNRQYEPNLVPRLPPFPATPLLNGQDGAIYKPSLLIQGWVLALCFLQINLQKERLGHYPDLPLCQ